LLLDFANRGDDVVIAESSHGQIETHLVIPHTGASVREVASADPVAQLQCLLHDHITVGTQQRILVLIKTATPKHRQHDMSPDFRAGFRDLVADCAELCRTRCDVSALVFCDATCVDEQCRDLVSLLGQPWDAKAGIETAGERKHDRFFSHRISSIVQILSD
jgi:hypothetical protein